MPDKDNGGQNIQRKFVRKRDLGPDWKPDLDLTRVDANVHSYIGVARSTFHNEGAHPRHAHKLMVDMRKAKTVSELEAVLKQYFNVKFKDDDK